MLAYTESDTRHADAPAHQAGRGSQHRRRVKPRALTQSERRELARLAARFQPTPPWTEEALQKNNAFRSKVIALYDSGATLEALAMATGWDLGRMATTIRKARAAGLDSTPVTFKAPAAGPVHRKATEREISHLRSLLDAFEEARHESKATEVALLEEVRHYLTHVSMEDMAEFLELPADTLRTRMKILPVGHFRATKTTVRPLTADEQNHLNTLKGIYRRDYQHQQEAQQTFINYARTLTASGVTQSSLAENLNTTRKTMSVWMRADTAPTPVSENVKVSADEARTLRRKYRSLPRNAAGGHLWHSDKGRDLARLLVSLRQQGVPLVELARVLDGVAVPVLGKVMSMYGQN